MTAQLSNESCAAICYLACVSITGPEVISGTGWVINVGAIAVDSSRWLSDVLPRGVEVVNRTVIARWCIEIGDGRGADVKWLSAVLHVMEPRLDLLVPHYVPWKSLQWHHNERNGVSNHQPRDCLLDCLFKAQIKEIIKALRHWPLWGEFTGDRWIPRTKGQ